MLFNSYVFIFVFLPVTVTGFYWLLRLGYHDAALAWLVLASLFFYGWWNPVYLLLLLGSLGFNHLMSLAIRRHQASHYATALLVMGVVANLGLLGYFKYANFFVASINTAGGYDFNLEHIVLPLAISFFTFQQITFLVDTARNKTGHGGLLEYALFVTFFPQLIAGPIVHHREMMPQFLARARLGFKWDNLTVGLSIFAIGLFKKVVIADGISVYSTPVFDAAANEATLTLVEAWFGAIAYGFQIYFDFSGYSDMAIGIARLFGIRLPLNFHSPYKADSVIEFWRRWHMTLSRFLRDYVYFTLGGVISVSRGGMST